MIDEFNNAKSIKDLRVKRINQIKTEVEQIESDSIRILNRFEGGNQNG